LIGWLFCAGHCRKRFNRYLRKFPDGIVIWTSPSGQTYTTSPGNRLLIPALCKPTAPVSALANGPRDQYRAKRTDAERARNRELREIREHPGNDCDDAYYPLPRPPGHDDPSPF